MAPAHSRTLHRTALISAVALALLPLGAATAARGADGEVTPTPTVHMTPVLQAQIQQQVENFREQTHSPGVSVAVVTPDADGETALTTYFTAGVLGGESEVPVDADTQFEIGSETKVFTADLFAALVAQGRVSPTDPVQMYAPEGVTVPRNGDPMTLLDLATHTAALPDDPANVPPCHTPWPECDNWRPTYTQTDLWAGFPSELPWPTGERYFYSDFGFALLGTILANVLDPQPADQPPTFQAALEGAFLTDLGMTSTMVEPVEAGPNFAVPSVPGTPNAPQWDNTNAFVGGGGLISSASDMAMFMKAHLGYVPDPSPGVSAMANTLRPVPVIPESCTSYAPPVCTDTPVDMALAWRYFDAGSGAPRAYKNGGTGGSSSDTEIAPLQRIGVTAMWNRVRPPRESVELSPAILTTILAAAPSPSPSPRPTGSTPALSDPPASTAPPAPTPAPAMTATATPSPVAGGVLARTGTDASGLILAALAAGAFIVGGLTLGTARRRRATRTR